MQILTLLISIIIIPFSAFSNSKPSEKTNAPIKILILGDSVSEGFGVSRANSYPVLVENKLKAKGHNVKIINASVSGSTTASAEKRLKWGLRNKPDFLFLALGGNDGLRGIKADVSRANLEKAIKLAKSNNVKVVLAGMLMPYNYGEAYRKEFSDSYAKLAKQYNVTFIPFLLKGVGGEKDYNLADGIHPNEKGYEIIANTIVAHLEKVL